MPRLPVESGCSARIARPAFVSSDGLATIVAPQRLDHRAAERLLVVRGANHVDLALEPELLAGERERTAPLARAGLGREALAALALVVEGLRDRGVRLVAAGGARALVLVEDPRAASRSPPRAGARGRAASGARAGRGRAPPPARRSRAPRSPPGGSAPSGRAAPGRPARPAAPCPDAGSAASGSACRRGRCTSAAGARIPRAGTSSAPSARSIVRPPRPETAPTVRCCGTPTGSARCASARDRPHPSPGAGARRDRAARRRLERARGDGGDQAEGRRRERPRALPQELRHVPSPGRGEDLRQRRPEPQRRSGSSYADAIWVMSGGLSTMPGFKGTLKQAQIRDVAAFLAKATDG